MATDTAVNAEMPGTIERQGGSIRQPTMAGRFTTIRKTQGAGKGTGQDVHGFGGEWYIISPGGTQVEAESE